jgi:MFS family permease
VSSKTPLVALLGSSLVSELGNSFSLLAIPWFVLATGGNAGQIGLVVAAGTLPNIVSGIFGGALVDRFGPKLMSIVADIVSGLAVAAIPLLHVTTGIAFWQLIILVVLGAVLDGPGATSRLAIFPDLIQRSGTDAERANTWYFLTSRFAGLLGAPLAGLAITAIGASALLWVNAASFVVAAILTSALIPHIVHATVASDVASPGTARGFSAYLGELSEGFRTLFGNQVLVWMTAVSLLGLLVAEPVYSVILPVYASDKLGSAAQLGLIYGALGAGSIVGNVLYLAIRNRISRSALYISGFTIRAACFSVFLFTPTWWQIAIAIFVGAVALEPVNPMTMSVRQEQVPPQLRGRVFGALSSMRATVYPASVVVFGFLLTALGIERTLILFVILNGLLPVVLVMQPVLRHIPTVPAMRQEAGTEVTSPRP